MKLCSSIILRPLCFLIFLGISSLWLSKLFLITKKIDQSVALQSDELHNKSILEIRTTAKLLLPPNSSALNLARVLGSSLEGTELYFEAIYTKVAPTLFVALSTIPHLSEVSYVGLDGLTFAFYNNGDQTLAVFSNTSLSSTIYTQLVNRDTGKLYGAAISSKSTLLSDNRRWFQNALKGRNVHSSLESGWNRGEMLFLNSVKIDGRGIVSIGFPEKVVWDYFDGINLNGGVFLLATNDGRVLVETEPLDTKNFKNVVNNGSVSVLRKENVLSREETNLTCGSRGSKVGKFEGAKKYKFYCSNIDIAGVPSVYVLGFPTKGLETVVHKNSKLAFTLLALLSVILFVSLCIFIFLILRAARREMFLCAALIKQMEATQQAERKSMNKSLAFASASHDVRGSLAAITGLIELCHDEAQPNSAMASNLVKMKTCVMDLLEILNSVLDTSKIEAGKMQLEEEEFNIVQLLEESVDMYYPVGVKKGIDVLFDPCDGSIFRSHHVKGDRVKLKQILGNLLSNAVKFTSEGHVLVCAMVKKPRIGNAIIVSNRYGALKFLSKFNYRNRQSLKELDELPTVGQKPNCVEFVFEVEDTGKGIPKEKHKSVFENFVQIKDSALGQGGSGLGLGIVQSLVRLMGGEIKIVTKEPGQRGTCFRFNIVLTSCHHESNDIQEQKDHLNISNNGFSLDFHQYFGPQNRSPPQKPEGSRVVLLIASEERRKVAKRVIENFGIKVSVAKQGKDLPHLLDKIKRKLDLSPSSSSERNELRLIDHLSKSDSNNGCDYTLPSYKKSNSKSSSCFILIVVDACAGTFPELTSYVANFKKDLPSSGSKAVWLENSITPSKIHQDDSPTPVFDLILSKAFHGSCIYQVLTVLPEFGGINGKNCQSSTSEIIQEKRTTNNSSSNNDLASVESSLKQIVIHKHEDSEKPLNGKKVLVVEDGEFLRMLATKKLQGLGAEVGVCQNGKEAYDHVCKVLGDQRRKGHSQALPYDYIFMDCKMPEMDGFEATKLIRMEEKHYGIHIPIIALTADAMAEDARKTISAGMDYHLTKPLQLDRLLEVITSIEIKQQH